MKKSILSFLLMFVALATFASRWTAPSMYDYSDRFMVYTQVNINGMTTPFVEVAAFIDGEVRGVADYSTLNNKRQLTLEVRGNESDNGKTITLKVAYDNLVYKVNKTLTYRHQGTYTPLPLVINVDAVTGVKLTDPLVINQNIGSTYDLSNDVTLLYGENPGDTASVSYQRKYETQLDTTETPLTYEWGYSNSSNWFTVGANNMLTVKNYGENRMLELRVYGPADPSIMSYIAQFEAWTYTNVTITKPAVPVSSMRLLQSTVTVNVGDRILDQLREIVKIFPDDASNKEFILVPNDTAQVGIVGSKAEGYEAKRAGEYMFRVVSEDNPSVYQYITLNILQPVTHLSWNGPSMYVEVWKGDNAYNEIAKYVIVNPANATNKTLTFTPSDSLAFSPDGYTKRVGDFVVYVGAEAGVPELRQLPVNVVVKQRVESIRVTPDIINVKIGDNVADYIERNVNISVLPETAGNRRYRLQPIAAHVDYFPNNIASAAGTYTWVVTSDQNPEVTANITVKVATPVSFRVPEFINLTLATPGQGKITGITGPYDSSRISFRYVDNAVDVAVDSTTITVRGKQLGDGEISVFYDGNLMGVISYDVKAEIQLEQGWNWVSNYTETSIPLKSASTDAYLSEYFTGANKILEVRSQRDVLYNDTEQYGAFGTITEFASGTMYKIRMENPRSLFPASSSLVDSSVRINNKGYVWIIYPIVGNHTMTYFNENFLLLAYKGCVIMGKDGFAEHDGSKWVASANFKLETGSGYIFYQPESRDLFLNFGMSYVEEAAAARAKSALPSGNVWNYDARAFADNMAVVAKINGIEPGSRYTVGAFVGDECRGKGEFVENGMMFINVSGEGGDMVKFRLYDSETDSYADILESMSYSMKEGSLTSPVTLTADMSATGIVNVEPSMQNNAKTFNMQGQQVNGNAKGLLIIGGKKIMKK